MEANVEIIKRFTSDNGKIFRPNDTIEFATAEGVVRGVVSDITEEKIILKDATVDKIAVSSEKIVKYSEIKDDTCKFVLEN